MIEFTCSICENKYPSIGGVPEECICNNCWEYDDITDDEDEKEFNLIKQRVDRENYKIGWREKDKE